MRTILLLALASAAVSFGSCSDPVHSAQVDALGPEAPGVKPGPLHRPGQPCLACHGSLGPGPEFTIAGTVYQTPDVGAPPAANVNVSIWDAPALGAPANDDAGVPLGEPVKRVVTNAAGNFYIPRESFSPVFPLRVAVDVDGLPEPTRMVTHIGRDGSCATCHFDPAGPSSPGHVYLVEDVSDLPGGGGQ